MTATTTTPNEMPTSAPVCPETAGSSRTATVVASALWVFVAGLLGYGIVQTAVKAVALFG